MFRTMLITIYYAILHSELWHCILGEFYSQFQKFLRFRQELSELSWEKGVETFVGIFLTN